MSKAPVLKTPKGTRDYDEKEMAIRQKMFDTIISVFKKHGAVTIDTPVFELKEILTGKYGEDSKLIYDLADQGGELSSLRYDLTVPFARFVAQNGTTYQNIKRYHIAKVYRRDQPSVNKGRLREFYQCDFDIAGEYEAMVPDAEAVKVGVEILSSLDIGPFAIKINHRKLLDGMFEVCGVPPEQFRAISSAVDKLDKLPWQAVRKEMVEEKHLPEEAADRIGKYVGIKGGPELCDVLASNEELMKSESAKKGVEDMRKLFRYLQIFGVADKVSFDLSLARGLDYYTGVIYEGVLLASDDDTSGIGSIAGGGRYDDLVGMFANGRKIPCVGISIGVERLFAILSKKLAGQVRSTETEVFVTAIGGLLEERLAVCNELWNAGIKAEFSYKAKLRFQGELEKVDKARIPFMVIVGAKELEAGTIRVKDTTAKEELVIPRGELLATLKSKLAKGAAGGGKNGDGAAAELVSDIKATLGVSQ
ncbi:hypothetical protein BJ742DRAFT_779519 [Cladochytrium replicatum]|nr:hypothetical protein BJ742DRAFT_779519 [Cladochytrium replicatum]